MEIYYCVFSLSAEQKKFFRKCKTKFSHLPSVRFSTIPHLRMTAPNIGIRWGPFLLPKEESQHAPVNQANRSSCGFLSSVKVAIFFEKIGPTFP